MAPAAAAGNLGVRYRSGAPTHRSRRSRQRLRERRHGLDRYRGPGTTNPPLYRTTDGGQTWQQLGADPGACQPQFVDAIHGWCVNIGAAAGSETVELYRTASGGQSWTLVSRTGFGAGAPSTPGALPFG